MTLPMTVVETEEFVNRCKAILTEAERDRSGRAPGRQPGSGPIGARNRRCAKRSGGRPEDTANGAAHALIYYYYNQSIPLFLLDVYAKNEKAGSFGSRQTKPETAASDARFTIHEKELNQLMRNQTKKAPGHETHGCRPQTHPQRQTGDRVGRRGGRPGSSHDG